MEFLRACHKKNLYSFEWRHLDNSRDKKINLSYFEANFGVSGNTLRLTLICGEEGLKWNKTLTFCDAFLLFLSVVNLFLPCRRRYCGWTIRFVGESGLSCRRRCTVWGHWWGRVGWWRGLCGPKFWNACWDLDRNIPGRKKNHIIILSFNLWNARFMIFSNRAIGKCIPQESQSLLFAMGII